MKEITLTILKDGSISIPKKDFGNGRGYYGYSSAGIRDYDNLVKAYHAWISNDTLIDVDVSDLPKSKRNTANEMLLLMFDVGCDVIRDRSPRCFQIDK